MERVSLWKVKPISTFQDSPFRYNKGSRVVEACALEPDLAILPNRELLLLSHYYCVQAKCT